jgi:ribosomal protein S18 acetylase RimI-like enzyme
MREGPRLAAPEELAAVGRLQHDFNREFGDPVPAPEWLAERFATLVAGGETEVLVTGSPPVGFAVLRYRPGLFSQALECYLAELYIAPAQRGAGRGRALMAVVLERARARGAGSIELATEETDRAARALYESLGFSNRHGGPDGPVSYVYEREL